MHISAILLVNAKGDVIISRYYRADVTEQAATNFRLKVIAAKEAGSQPPIKLINNCSFLYLRHANIYFVAVTAGNVNPALVFQFLKDMIAIFSAYFDKPKQIFDESALRNNFTLVYELLDEVMDFGYPQTTAIGLLKSHINTGKMKEKMGKAATLDTKDLTGAVDWRRDGLVFKKNEVFIDVVEKVELLMSANGDILRNEVHGEVNMRTCLSGMPECKFGLNDKVSMDKEQSAGPVATAAPSKKTTVKLTDCTFHRCVRLGKFEDDRSITFIPPDGKFVLMKYRITDNIKNPFRLIPVIEITGTHKADVNLKVIADFDAKVFATKVKFKIPLPRNAAISKKIKTSVGKAKYEASEDAIIWRIRKFPGGSEFKLQASASLMDSTTNKTWSRPPISVEYQVPMFTASGLHVRFLKVYEKSGYQSQKWVRYLSKAASYKIRI